jgi:hypothetical protein
MSNYLKITILAFLLIGCKLRSYNLSEKSPAEIENIDRVGFFNHSQVWYFRISGWDRSKIQSWQIPERTKVDGSRFEIFRLDESTAAKTWCPSPEEIKPKDKIFSTTAFNVSLRGDKSKGTPKGSYLISFEKENERFLDLKRIHLVAMFNDLSQMREALSQKLLSFLKVPSPRNSYVRFCLDDVYRGLYINIEEVDKRFISEVLDKPSFVSIYEGRDGSEPDAGQLSPRIGTASAFDRFEGKGYKKIAGAEDARFQDFDQLLNRIDFSLKNSVQSGTPDTLSEIFDVDTFIRWMAVNQMIGGWDNYYYNSKNYFLVNSGSIEKPYFHWVPIDLDNTFGVSFTQQDWSKTNIFDWESVKGGTHRLPLVRLILTRPEWRKKYDEFLSVLVSSRPPHGNAQMFLFGEISAIWKMIESSVVRESDSENIDYSKEDPFKMAHTARQFTTSDIRLQVTEDSVNAPDPAGWANMKSPHLRTYIKRKWKNVSEQLAKGR